MGALTHSKLVKVVGELRQASLEVFACANATD